MLLRFRDQNVAHDLCCEVGLIARGNHNPQVAMWCMRATMSALRACVPKLMMKKRTFF